MTAFLAYALWLLICLLLVQLFQRTPLPPEEPETVTIDPVVLREAAWLDRPVINLKLSGRWVKR